MTFQYWQRPGFETSLGKAVVKICELLGISSINNVKHCTFQMQRVLQNQLP